MSDEKKIIIDEDWKSQVEAEKAAFEKDTDPKQGPDQTAEPATGHGFPPASFELLVSTFVTEAMVALGQFPNPVTNEQTVNLEHARYSIDMLQMIEEKTKGNLSTDEALMIESLLHQLRMAFVSVQNTGGLPPAGDK